MTAHVVHGTFTILVQSLLLHGGKSELLSIVNDIRNFVFGLAGATVYGSCKSRKQKFVMSFTITVYHSIKKKTINEFTNVNIDQY